KSLARIKRMHERGAAIVLVTHSLDTAQFIAQRGIVLDEGRIVATGSSVEALRAYERLVFHGEALPRVATATAPASAAVTILKAGIYGDDGRYITTVEMGAPFGIEVECQLHRTFPPVFSLALVNATGVVCVWNLSAEDGLRCDATHGRLRLRAWYPENHLMKGFYRVAFPVQGA